MTATPPQPTPVVTPDGRTRLAQLAERYADLKPRAEELAAEVKSVTDAIKAELAREHPDARAVELHHPAGNLRMKAVTSWRLDTKKLKAEKPEVYVEYAYQNSYYELRKA